MLIENALNVFPDGSMYSNPRSGGIGIVFAVINAAGDDQVIKQLDPPGYKQATNQEMELEACIVALEEALDDESLVGYEQIEVFTDSKYVEGNYKNAMFVWPRSQWKNRVTDRPILHVPQWKRLLRVLQHAQRQKRRININWIKGHKKNPYNKAADKAAKRSAKNALNGPLSVVSVRRKVTSKKTEIGSVKMQGQHIEVRVLTTEWLGSPHRLWKYKYEVLSADSPYTRNVDEIFSALALRDGRHYEVRLNASTANPRILELIREIERTNNAKEPAKAPSGAQTD